jgi:TPR repeat protein
MPISKSDLAQLNKAKAAMKRAEYAPHASRGLRDARKLLKSLVEKNIAEAQYLAASFALADEFTSDADFNKWRYNLIHQAAESGHARAQFVLGQAYGQYGDLEHDPEKSAYWFSLSAEQGYPPAQWEHGLNLFVKDEALG